MDELVWTTDKPTKEGWYWLKTDTVKGVVAVITGGGKNDRCRLWIVLHGHPVRISDVDGEWAGPLEEPRAG
jgi:hypothetical protein